MNICLLTASFLPLVGGREFVVHNLATALSQLGHNVFVLTSFRKGLRFEGNVNYTLLHPGFQGMYSLKLTVPVMVASLAVISRKYKIDVINVHEVFRSGTWTYFFRRIFKNIPVVGTPHGDDIQMFPELNYGVRLYPESDRIVRRNVKDFLITTSISPSIHHHIREILGYEETIRGVPNGIWTSSFDGTADRIKVREEYGIPQDSVALISVGRNHPKKGFLLAVEALAKLANGKNKVSYVLVGRNMAPLVSAAESLGVSDLLFTPGQVNSDEISKLYQACDIYVSPSYVESFGLTTIEAMSAGLPCVVSNVEGNRDLVAREWGDFFEVGDFQGLTDALRRMMENPAMLKSKGERARLEAKQYDWLKIAEMYVSVYSEAIELIQYKSPIEK